MVKAKTDQQSPQETSSKELAVLPSKEINSLRGSTSTLVTSANTLVIRTADDLPGAADLLKAIKTAKGVVEKRKEEITRPLMASLASARDLFKPFESAYKDAENIVKGKVLEFQNAEDARIEAEKERIATQVDKGKISGAKAIAKIENLGGVATSATGASGTIQTRTLTKVRVVDESLIPREYLVPDMNKITKAILQEGVEIAGVEKYQEKSIASK